MASIGSLSSSTSSSISGSGGLKGYGGLASGLDRDSLIESMTYATRARIAKQQQKKQTYQWKQDAYRSVTDKLVALSSKYMDYTNPTTNLSASSLFDRTNIVASGKNASKVSVTASGSNAADSLTILGVKQMAKNASATSGSAASDGVLRTGSINFGKEDVSVFQDQSLQIEYEGKTYTVNFGEIENPTNAKEVAKQLNKALENVKTGKGEGENLSKVVKFSANGSQISLKAQSGQTAKVTGGSSQLLESMGIKTTDSNGEPIDIDKTITSTISISTSSERGGISKELDFKDRIAGQSLTFSYNGNQVTINMPSAEDIDKLLQTSGDGIDNIQDVVKYALQDGFNRAFGKDRIAVSLDESTNSFTFKTTLPGGGDDKTSILTLDYGSAGMVGKHRAFHTLAGESNHLNLNASIEDSGLDLKNLTADDKKKLDAAKQSITINGKTIEIEKGASVSSIIDAINNDPDMGVSVSYMANSDKFVINAKAEGASGEIKLGDPSNSTDITNILFGSIDKDKDIKAGQDAIVTVQYAGSSEQVNLVRSSNSFTQDGLNITLKGTFGVYEEQNDRDNPADAKIDIDKNAEAGNEVTFEAKANTDSLLTTIKDMVAAYNEIVDLVNGLASTKPDRDYAPLTDEQKEEMTEEQIEKWEKKAKEGILFGDDLMRGLSSDLRFVISGSFVKELSEIGITEAAGYTSNGKLVIDENKLKNALEAEPDKVAKLFTDKDNGLMSNMKKVTDSYAKTWGTKGSLIQRAGSESAAVSLTDNELYKSMKDIDDIIKQLQTRLKSEQDRYIAQFTRLETAIAQMNSQSSYLSSMSGGY